VKDEDLLPAELLDRLEDLEWAARLVVRGVGAGIHRSSLLGRGEDFDRHRPYQQGDDVRHLDWKLLARTDRLYVRQFRESSSLRAMLVLDATPSMRFGPGGVSKLRYAVLLAAAMAHLLRRADDLPGLAVAGAGGGEIFLPPRHGREAFHTLLHTLVGVADGSGPGSRPLTDRAGPGHLLPTTLDRVAHRMPAGGRVVILSDFLDENSGDLVRTAGLLRARGDEVTAVRILTPEELGEAGGAHALYTDPEAPGVRIPGAPARDPGYRNRLDAHFRHIARALEHRGAEWIEARTDEAPAAMLRRWLRETRGAGAG
jgi:uncharacterized protein (DUF58 family)